MLWYLLGNSYTYLRKPYIGTERSTTEMLVVKRRLLLDSKLVGRLRIFVLQILYMASLIMVCSHNIVDKSFRQNDYLKNMLNPTYKVIPGNIYMINLLYKILNNMIFKPSLL